MSDFKIQKLFYILYAHNQSSLTQQNMAVHVST